jgi:hypothetical protein
MPVFRIKNKTAAQSPKNNSPKQSPKEFGPALGKPAKASKISTVLAFAGFFISIGGLGLYINESKAGQKNEPKQYLLNLSVVDSLKQPVIGATLKSLQRPIGVTNDSGQWKKAFAIVAGSEYPITVEGKDNQGRLEVKHVKLVFPHWTKSSSVMNRLIRLDTLKNEIPLPAATVVSASVEGTSTQVVENKDLQVQNTMIQNAEKPNATPNTTPNAAIVSQSTMTKGPTSAVSTLSSKESGNPSVGAPSQDVPTSGKQVTLGNQSQTAAMESLSPGKLSGIHPKELTKIWIRTEGPSSSHLQSRGQTLEAVKDKLQIRTKSLGFIADEKAPLTLSLKNLDGKLGNETQDVIQVDVHFAGKHMETFLRNYQEDALTTARLILWRARLSLPVSYQVKKEGDRILAMQPLEGPELWGLSEGVNLSDSNGAIGIVSKETPKSLSIPVVGASKFCNSPSCRAQLIPGEVSQKGWSKRTLTVLGGNGRNLKVFAAGNIAAGTKGEYFYEGLDNGFTVFTVLEEGKIIYRNALHNNLYQQTILTLPVASLSRR